MSRTALVPGSFDPVTLGHVDLIARACALFDRVLVVAMQNDQKKYLFTQTERVLLLKSALSGLKNATVEYWGGMLYEYAAAHKVHAIVKGVRDEQDCRYELEMAAFNKLHYPAGETILLPAQGARRAVSSSAVKRLFFEGCDVSGMVGEDVLKMLIIKRNEGKQWPEMR